MDVTDVIKLNEKQLSISYSAFKYILFYVYKVIQISLVKLIIFAFGNRYDYETISFL